MDITWHHPFTSLLCGSTGCGKSSWIKSFLQERNKLMTPCPKHRILFYTEPQELYTYFLRNNLITRLVCVQDELSYEKIKEMCLEYKTDGGCLLIIDDAWKLMNSEAMQLLFVQGSHHLKASLMVVTQTLFGQTKDFRVCSLNSQIFVIFKSPRDSRQLITFGSQMYPYRKNFFLEAYNRSTRQPYGYLVISCRQETPEVLRLVTNIFAHQFPPICFVQRSNVM